MNDLISRQAALDLAKDIIVPTKDGGVYRHRCIDPDEIRELPSAQPEITLESAIDYLHSIGWMQEHDRILTESAQPERKKGKWVRYAECDCLKCDQCGMPSINVQNFCSRCGADMRGEE